MKIKDKVIYVNDKPFQIFGVNVCGFEIAGHGFCLGGLWNGATPAQIAKNIRKAGFNTVRLPVHPKVFENNVVPQNILGAWPNTPNEGLLGKRSLEMLDLFVKELEAEGIYFIIDHHYLDAEGKIPPMWYTSDYPEARWLNDLAQLAEAFKLRPGFIGIDIKNEPGKGCTWGSGDPMTDWKIACEKAFYAIDKVNKDCLIITESFSTTSINEMVANPPAIPESRLLMSIHEYGPDVWPWMEGVDDPSFPANQTAILDVHLGNAAKKRAIYVGEFGGQYGKGSSGIKDKLWQDFLIAYMAQRSIVNFSVWAYGPNAGGETGGITDDSYLNLRTDKLDALAPLRTAGAVYIGSSGSDRDPEPPHEHEPFNVGDIVVHKSGTGPKILYLGGGDGEFWNDRGELCRVNVDRGRFEKVMDAW